LKASKAGCGGCHTGDLEPDARRTPSFFRGVVLLAADFPSSLSSISMSVFYLQEGVLEIGISFLAFGLFHQKLGQFSLYFYGV
jgi:hypothetical protein